MRLFIVAALAFLSLSVFAQEEAPPKLIVGIVVDQMRNDYLHRFADQYGDDGFKRLMKEGFYAANHHFSYMPTTTGPGHASVYTGTTPGVHGIVGNNWWDPVRKYKMYCVEDKSVKTIGASNADGQMSPKNLKTTTITDELRMFTNYESKVIGISLKDRGAILPAGHVANGAYWLSDGNFITSSYYAEELPKWVSDFNKQDLVSKYLNDGWNTLLPIDEYTNSLPDNNPYEAIMAGEKAPVFPRDLNLIAADNGGRDVIKITPFGNSLALAFAKEAIESEGLGKDDVTDFLALSFSSPDYMGHAYGPRAVEVQDTYLRLDQDLAAFFKMLDETVGKGNYTVFLTADHGGAEVSQYNIDRGLPGGYIDNSGARSFIDSLLFTVDTVGRGLIEKIEGNKLFWNKAKVAEAGLDLDDISAQFADAFMTFPGIYGAYPVKSILWGSAAEFPTMNIQRGLYPPLAGDVIWVMESGWLDYGKTGTSHGTPWRYDTHVPLLMMGNGVAQGLTYRETNIRDIAPTVSMMFNIPLPSGATGSPITEAIK
jgi:predicted AlkP superfamily pyrophosphatase or phosphodiesterase